MNHFMDYVCRGIVRSEDAVRCLNKRVAKLAKCNNQLATATICLGIAGILTLAVVAAQDNEIKALRRQVDVLSERFTDIEYHTANTTEEETQQEGA